MLSYLNRTRGIPKNGRMFPGAGLGGGDEVSEIRENESPSQIGVEVNNPNEGAILFRPAVPQTKRKHKSPQDALDEFWGNFNSKTPGKASTVLPKDEYARKVGEKVPKGTTRGQNAVASYEEAARICKAKVDKIVKECRRVNQKYRDVHFDIEFDMNWKMVPDTLTMLGDTSDIDCSHRPRGVKRVGDIFDKPEFFKAGATASDVRQGFDGDCWFLAALCTLANKPGLIEKICVHRDEEVGVYGFVFYRDGEWISEIIDDKLFLIAPDYDESWIERPLIENHQRINSEEDYRKIYQNGSNALYFAQCEDANETWLPLLEKAFAKAHGDYQAIEGGFTGEAIEDLTGGVTTELFSSDVLDKEYFWKEEILKVNQDFLFGCYTGLLSPYGHGERKGIVEGHAYSIMKAVEIEGQRLCLLKNPWGKYEWSGPWSDGSKEWTPEWMQKLNHRFGDDGAFWMSYEDLLKKFQFFDRTRLFDDEWKVTQQWTQLTVPWSTDYHSTRFSFTVEKQVPVVLVFSQLNERYFCGLEGEYSWKLSFRVHKVGDDEYVIRSHGNYCMNRSVTAELELEEGEYHLLMKVEAQKREGALPVETVVRNNAKGRRDKLVRIGLAYDLAHAKGQFKETDEEKRLKKKIEANKKAKQRKEIKDKLMKEKKRRKHNENKERRKERAAEAKRKAKEKKKAERKAEKEKEKEKKREKEAEKEAEKEKIKGSGADQPKEIAIVSNPNNPAKSDELAAEKVASTDSSKAIDTTTTETPTEISHGVAGEDSKSTEIAPSAEKAATKEESKPVETSPTDKTTSEKTPGPVEAVKSSESNTSNLVAPEIRINGSAPPSEAGLSDTDSDDDLSDIESVVSDISSGEIDDIIEDQELAAENSRPLPLMDDEEDEFQRDPWNAIAVVGLRVYAKGGGVSVKLVRPLPDAGTTQEKKKEEKSESKLDVDDSAVDATKGVEVASSSDGETPQGGGLVKDGIAGSQKSDIGSEGSGVLV